VTFESAPWEAQEVAACGRQSRHSKFSRAGNLTTSSVGHTGVQASVLRVNVLENKCQCVLFIFEQNFESLIRVKFLSCLEPCESGFLARFQGLFFSLEQGKNILSILDSNFSFC
jgi:hypothetical protein